MSQSTNNSDFVSATGSPVASPVAAVAAQSSTYFLGFNEKTPDGAYTVGNGGVTQDPNTVLVFTSVIGDTYSLYDNGIFVGTMTATRDATGWKLSLLTDGSHNLVVSNNTQPDVTPPMQVSLVLNTSLAVPTSITAIDTAGPMAGTVAAGGISTDSQPVISGAGHQGNIISVYDGTTLLGTAIVGFDSKWSFQPETPLPNGSHNIHVTALSINGTSDASAPYPFSTTQIMVTGLTSSDGDIANGGTAHGTVTVTGWIADPSLASKGIGVYLTGGNQGTTRMWDNSVVGKMTIEGNIFTAVIAKDSLIPGNFPLAEGTYHIDIKAVGDSTDIRTTSNPALGWTFTEASSANVVHAVAATHDDASIAAAQVASADAQASASPDAADHPVLQSTNVNHTIDLGGDPASYFKDASVHVHGSASGIDTLHLTGDHQVLDLTSLTGKTAAAKVSGIESVDLGGAHNMLKLSLVDVLNLAQPDLFQKDGKQQMLINGSNGDSVDLSNSHIAGVTDGHWMLEGTAVVSGVSYTVYEHSGAHAELLVQQGVQIALHG